MIILIASYLFTNECEKYFLSKKKFHTKVKPFLFPPFSKLQKLLLCKNIKIIFNLISSKLNLMSRSFTDSFLTFSVL